MQPTLLVGDYLFASKFSYGYSRYSIPFSQPLFSGRILGREPERGDIVVFHRGADNFIKRVIGLPDRIQLKGGVVTINGTPAERRRVADFVGRDPCGFSVPGAPPVRIEQWRETLPNGVSFNTLQCALRPGFPDDTDVYMVPAGHFFMMGDNRENSEDSRFPDVAYVPFENLVGRAAILFFSIDRTSAKPAVRFERLGASVR